MKTVSCLLAISLLFVVRAFPDDEGHHHEDLTAQQLGTVHFPTTCTEDVQKNFERGVALLHSFWYEEAQKQFQQVAQDDRHCAMAHWGIAMSLWHELWNHPDAKTIKKGKAEAKKAESLHSRDDRERGYIAAVEAFYGGKKTRTYQVRADAYAKGMRAAYEHHPEDTEAAVFYALSLLASAPDHDTTFTNQKKAAAILEMLLATEPDHPGVAHYLIHSYDSPRYTCHRTFLRGLVCGRTTSIPILPRSQRQGKLPPCIWAAKGISSTRWIFLNMHTCRVGVKQMRSG
jgi:hypothetical protein